MVVPLLFFSCLQICTNVYWNFTKDKPGHSEAEGRRDDRPQEVLYDDIAAS